MTQGQDKPMISNIRVLDERAFAEFSGKLSELIKEAAASSKTLDDLVTRTYSLSESATSAKSQLDQRLELSARVLKITKGQLDRVEGALGALNDSQRKVDDLSADLRRQLGEFNTHLEHAMAEVDQRVTKAVDGLENQRREGDHSRNELGQLMGLARRLGEHFAAVEGQLSGGVEAFQQGLRQALEEIASVHTRADRASSKLDEQVFALKSRVVAFADGIEQWLKPALAEMETQRKDMGRVSDDVRQQFNELIARVGQAFQDIEDRINIGLGDLSSRHQGSERTTASIQTALDDLREDIRSRLVDELRAHIDATCVNQTDLASRLGELQGRLEVSLNRVGNEVSATLEGFNARARSTEADREAAAHRSQLADSQAHMSEVLVRVEDRLTEALRSLDDHRDAETDFVASQLSAIRENLASLGSRMETEVEPLLATLRQRLRDDLEHKIIAATERLDSRVAEVLSELDARSRRVEDDTAAHREQLGRLLELMSGAVERLERQVTEPLHALVQEKSDEGGQMAEGIADLKIQLREAMDSVTGRLTRIEPGLGGIDARLGEIADRLDAVSGRPAADGGVADGAFGARLADLQEQLKDSTQQLDCRVAEILAELGRVRAHASGSAPPAGDPESAPGAAAPYGSVFAADLEDRLIALSDQLRTVDNRLTSIAPHLEALGQVPAGAGISADVIAETVGRLEERINEGLARSEQHFLEALAKLETSMAARTVATAAAPGASAATRAATGTQDPKKLITALLAAVNSGDKQAIRRFVATEYAESSLADRSVDDRIEVYMSFHEDAGDLELRNIERSDDNEIVALVQERGTLEWHRLQLQLDPKPPHKVMVVNIDSV